MGLTGLSATSAVGTTTPSSDLTLIPTGVSATSVYYFDIENAHLGSTQWGMIFQHGQSTNNTR